MLRTHRLFFIRITKYLFICLFTYSICCIPMIQSTDVAATDVTPSRMLFHGPGSKKMVALTFDDGPDHDYTLQILDILKEYHVPATFFIVGRLAKRYPSVLNRIISEGHVIGNHSWDHPDFTELTPAEINHQLRRTNRMVFKLTGKQLRFFRPPFGAIDRKIERQIVNKGYSIIYWNVDTKDWSGRSAKRILSVVKRSLKPGSIILFHSAGGHRHLKGTILSLPKIIRLMREKGYEMVTIDRLFDLPAYQSTTKQ
ncbi:Peptidoglycan/xylan/chitin deacetylase, PgdA/CDA1 family [Seinonella peptonophila]|uniref:Peptidoglycan/xylan/chitin deacetylase, PgdA/CDA1 family n=2 Tax=Seinonella peptonophila TaxID=112248 RepID=A0A1M4TRZ2_9BACL|nr:Peptidoglycan/xylan/chitin deacetylase, PgdA/CDA1 family [Seinonella peptonophila]